MRPEHDAARGDGGKAAVVRARGLVKRFGALVAVDGVDLTVASGRCLGLLGPNGAGKTTTIEMLEGLTAPDAGEIEILGLTWRRDARAIRQRIGVQLQETRMLERVKVHEALALFRSFYPDGRAIEEVLDLVGLAEKRDALVKDLSGGQHQRLTLGCALVSKPRVLFLDEPTTGLDPQARRRVWEIVEGFKREGGTVLLTTHYMEEAERLADDVAIMDRGRIIAEGTPRAVIDRLGAESIVEIHPREGSEDAFRGLALEELAGVRAVRREVGAIALSVADTQACVGALFAAMQRDGLELEDLRTHRPTLEDVFVSLTGKHLRDG